MTGPRWRDGALEYRYTTLADLEDIAVMLAKPRVCEHVYFGPNTREQTLAYFRPLVEPMQAALAAGGAPEHHVFTIRQVDDGAFVGECAVVPVAFAEGHFTVGYQLEERFWGRGIGTRAGQFVVWFGLRVLGAHRLSADCLASNAASARILETCGFRREACQRRYYTVDGEPRDQLLFGLLREESTLDLDAVAARLREAHG